MLELTLFTTIEILQIYVATLLVLLVLDYLRGISSLGIDFRHLNDLAASFSFGLIATVHDTVAGSFSFVDETPFW
jgi:hypothetical protein